MFVGIDVSKAQLDVALRPEERWAVPNEATGIATLIDRLQTIGPTLVVLEATGGMERPLVRALVIASLPVVVVNPRQVRDFAKATGRLAKTDRLDADMLAHFAEVIRPAMRRCRMRTRRRWLHGVLGGAQWSRCSRWNSNT